ncbi:hypothetical protein NE237_024115 [Protea cynaroides]|uniref:Uncharacterized protein n=1 Tax=Protea cynaroides TaxID=273540 RepID=A0A9Q0HCS4_9MAGN|nr:hypothetical protein NE237_024115 [Protea cynaroides]
MGQGQEVKTREEPKVDILEKGKIFFFYRPKVDKEEVHSADDVQRLYIVLRPESGKRAVEEKQSPDSGKEESKNEAGEGASGSSRKSSGKEGSINEAGEVQMVPVGRAVKVAMAARNPC